MSKGYWERRFYRATKYLKKRKSYLLRMAASKGITTGIAVFILPHVFVPVKGMIWGSHYIPADAKETVIALIQKTLGVD
jgi:hypothetical protein